LVCAVERSETRNTICPVPTATRRYVEWFQSICRYALNGIRPRTQLLHVIPWRAASVTNR